MWTIDVNMSQKSGKVLGTVLVVSMLSLLLFLVGSTWFVSAYGAGETWQLGFAGQALSSVRDSDSGGGAHSRVKVAAPWATAKSHNTCTWGTVKTSSVKHTST